MKSVVFSFKKSDFFRNRRFSLGKLDYRYFFKRYGLHTIVVVLLLAGLLFGAVYAKNADSQLLDSLDFLFTTNLDNRLEQNALGTFCACFASDFIFLSVIFILGLAPWGIPALPLVIFFKGFGTGITAGYLIYTYALKGAGFYLLILLPGTFLFCLALISISVCSYKFSKQMFSFVASRKSQEISVHSEAVRYCSSSMSALIMTFLAAILDAVLWTLFSGAFNF